jgi:hypothetical protein
VLFVVYWCGCLFFFHTVFRVQLFLNFLILSLKMIVFFKGLAIVISIRVRWILIVSVVIVWIVLIIRIITFFLLPFLTTTALLISAVVVQLLFLRPIVFAIILFQLIWIQMNNGCWVVIHFIVLVKIIDLTIVLYFR